MVRSLACFVGFRYLSTGRGRGLVSFMSAASFIGIALGVAAVIVTLSAMNGLEGESRSRLLSMAQHVSVWPEDEDEDLEPLRAALSNVEGVVSASPFVSFEAMLLNGSEFRPVIVRGIDPALEGETRLAGIVGQQTLGILAAGSGAMVLGQYVADNLRILPGDAPVEILLADLEGGRFGIRRALGKVADTFSAGDEAYDAGLALMHLDDASRMIGLDGRPEGLSIYLAEPMDVARVESALRAAAGPGYRWSNWATENSSLFRAMRIEKIMMTILLLTIVAVAAFNIVTSLTMVVNEKEKDIAVLRTLGYEPAGVMRIFMFQGGFIGLVGTLTGLGIGLAIAYTFESILVWAEQTFGFRIMPGDVFYVTRIPTSVELFDVLMICTFAFLTALFATVWPSRNAARIEPAEVLRYE